MALRWHSALMARAFHFLTFKGCSCGGLSSRCAGLLPEWPQAPVDYRRAFKRSASTHRHRMAGRPAWEKQSTLGMIRFLKGLYFHITRRQAVLRALESMSSVGWAFHSIDSTLSTRRSMNLCAFNLVPVYRPIEAAIQMRYILESSRVDISSTLSGT